MRSIDFYSTRIDMIKELGLNLNQIRGYQQFSCFLRLLSVDWNIHFWFFLSITVNSEANSRRITMVEGCFGSSGQVSWLKCFSSRPNTWINFQIIVKAAIGDSGPGARWRRCPDKDVPKAAEGSAILSVQRYLGLWQHCHWQKKIQQTAHHPTGRGTIAGIGRQWTWVYHKMSV